MRNIQRHSDLVHAPDDARSVLGQSPVHRVGGSAAEPVPVVGELRNTLADAIEKIDVLLGSEMRRILLAQHDSDLAQRLHMLEIVAAVDAVKFSGMRGEKRVPVRQIAERGVVY